MKKIKKFFSKLDYYGTKFHFQMAQKMKFKTFIGGIITLILSIFAIMFLFIFGHDFFFRTNPNFTQSSIGEKYSKINLKKEKFILAFRFEDEFGFPLEIKNSFLKIYYYIAIPDENDVIRNDYKEEYIPYKLCDESDFEGTENLVNIYGDLYCIDWSNLTFGGYWDNEYIYYLEIRLFYCQNGESYSFNQSKCSSIEELSDYYNHNNIYFSMYYTATDFRVNDLKNPLNRKYKNYYTFISHNFRKTDRLFIQEQILNDDQGWIISAHKNISIWGGQVITSDYKYYSDETINEEGFDTMIYAMNLYMSNEKMYYTRKYMKVPDILSLVGGFLTCINIIGKVINKKINLSIKKRKIVRKLFGFNENHLINSSKICNNNNIGLEQIKFNKMKTSIVNNDFENPNNNHGNSISRLFSMNSFINSNSIKSENSKKNNSNFIYLYNKNFQSFQIKNNNNNIYNNSKYNVNILNDSKNNKKVHINIKTTSKRGSLIKKTDKNQKIIENKINKIVIEDFKRLFCFCRKKEKSNFYDKTNFIYSEQINIYNYFKTSNEVNFLKKLFLSKYQNLSIEFTNKINIKNINPEKYNNLNKIKEVVNYFKYIYKHKINSNLDNFIYDNLQNEIKCLI